MQQYKDLISQFLYTELPTTPVSKEVQFEALAATVFGSKQRRQGPMPSPEVQVRVRDVLRERPGKIDFLVPWGSSKQDSDGVLDVLEFMALRQLKCLADELDRMGTQAIFHFRVEDLTDQFLFETRSTSIISIYGNHLDNLIREVMRRDYYVHFESNLMRERGLTLTSYNQQAQLYADFIEKYLRGEIPYEQLASIGWKGTIPLEMREYYNRIFARRFPGEDLVRHMARYFGNTFAKVRNGLTGAPITPFIQISFSHPVPGTPITRPTLYYRTLPERYTNIHISPWNGTGYFRIDKDNCTTPRIWDGTVKLYPETCQIGDALVHCPYSLED